MSVCLPACTDPWGFQWKNEEVEPVDGGRTVKQRLSRDLARLYSAGHEQTFFYVKIELKREGHSLVLLEFSNHHYFQ